MGCTAGALHFAADSILARLRPGELLDLGAGASALAEAMTVAGCRVTALDHDEAALEAAPGTHNRIRWDMREVPWPFEDESFDGVVAVYALQHLLGFEALAWAESRRVLRPGGQFLCGGRYRERCAVENTRADPLNGYSVEGLRALAMATGFEWKNCVLGLYDGAEYRFTDERWANVFCLELVRP
jgi:SAM-dependent methyltransferase